MDKNRKLFTTARSLNPFVVADVKKCIGCRLCEIACATSHSSNASVLTIGNINAPLQPRLYLVHDEKASVPVQCRHCEDAPCANSCPLGAIEEVDNRILIHEEICVACKSCVMSCPFGAIEIMGQYANGRPALQNFPVEGADSQGKQIYFASKCDRCIDLESPACISVCPEHALRLFSPESHKRTRMLDAALSLSKVSNHNVERAI